MSNYFSIYTNSSPTNTLLTNYSTAYVTNNTLGSSVTTIVTSNALYTTNETITVVAETTNVFPTNIPTPVFINAPQVLGTSQTAVFTASIGTNTAGMGFQWQLNGTNLPENGSFTGTTTSNLNIRNVVASDAGDYSIIVGSTYVSPALNFAKTNYLTNVTVAKLLA